VTKADGGHRDKCAIAGIGQTEYSRQSGRSELTLATEATLSACEDAGIEVDEIDGLVQCDMDRAPYLDLSESLGLSKVTYYSAVGPGGAAPPGMVAQAVGAILSGQASTVLVYRSLNGRSSTRFGEGAPGVTSAPRVGGFPRWDEFYLPYGLTSPGQFYALIARRYMHEYGAKQEHLGRIAATCRERANANPAAQMHDRKLSLDDYVASRVISDPLRLFDFCLETDGACALVVTSTERARDLKQPPAIVCSVAQSTMRGSQGGMCYGALARNPLLPLGAVRTAETVYQRAGIGPQDIDVAQLYDCFTITVLLQLEEYGFCERGGAADFIDGGNLDLTGRLPINTSGGHLSEGYIHGLNLVVEGVRQMRGSSTSQVADAETCLVTAAPPMSSSCIILTKDR
jgi:acetyl-CoA acetyltransferase